MKDFLKKIINDKKKDEILKLNAVEIVNRIFDELQERERDILSRRFALSGHDSQTLEEIGRLHNLTRERVRQIERASLEKIKKLDSLDKRLETVRGVVEDILDEHGGIMEKDFLLDILSILTLQVDEKELESKKKNSKNYFEFILSNLLTDHIEKVDNSERFSPFYKVKDKAVNYLEDIVDELKSNILSVKKTMKIDELIETVKNSKTFNLYKDKIIKEKNNLDLTSIFKNEIFPEKGETINSNKPLYSMIHAVKDINRNKMGHWGHDSWPEVKPKRISDKIYLILNEEGKPMHFTEITEKINKVGFDHKKANAGSVHNELILDDRYILVDRGIYGLKTWQK
ncbi:hypothetical protein CVU82_02470 [Candidatus Falkowbacteria bacterium HGW-Falkowbacteria-1]|uniref:HTH HARE-type domain-containing protein n=1 Tax=Candidatus Falkowbacteria bacterium HGW-Falkowbacteria-1 TaxID=2013768 RepID=A0A2N2E9P3_9BACT|nr:MAG: hypothetical protein CVU82_02470 [Candidatus Falkowbacteria bacterium HGW-Falkowbacteria-1]